MTRGSYFHFLSDRLRVCADAVCKGLAYHPGSVFNLEGNHPRWGGQTSNLDGGAMRCRVGSTPISFRQFPGAP